MKPTQKLTNSELLSISSGINFLTLESPWDKNLANGQRTLIVKFSRPVLKRPLCDRVADVALAWAKAHPRQWVVTVTAHCSDGKVFYDETIELEAFCKLNELTEAYTYAVSDVTGAVNPNHMLGVSWKAKIKTTAERKKA